MNQAPGARVLLGVIKGSPPWLPSRTRCFVPWRRGSRRRIPPTARRPPLRPHIAMRNSRSGRSACRARLVGTLSPLLRLPAVRAQPSRNPAVPSTRQFGRHAKRVLEQAGARPRSLIGGRGPQLLPRRRGGTVARLTRPARPFGCPPPCVGALSYPTCAPSVYSAATDGAMRAAARRRRARGRAVPWTRPPRRQASAEEHEV